MLRAVPLLLLFLLASCARPPEPVWTELPTVDGLLLRIAETTGRVNSLDAAAKVGLTSNGTYRSSQQFLLAEKPDRLRADVLTGFGQLVLQLASDGHELSVFLNTTVPGRFFRGAASDENLARFTRMALPARDMVSLLLYDPPLIAYRQAEVRLVDGQLRLYLVAGQREQELLFDNQLNLVGCRYLAESVLLLEVLFLQLDDTDKFPRRVQIELPAEQTRLVFNFTELQTNINISNERFRLPQPANIAVENLP